MSRASRLALPVVIPLLVCLFLSLHLPVRAGLPIVYVDASVVGGNNDGSSWANAYSDLQDALAVVTSGSEIWVAAGVYTPGTVVSDTFVLPAGVSLYGGFAGGETTLVARDWTNNVTVLSGDIDANDAADANGVVTDTAQIQGDNAYTVLSAIGLTQTSSLDGFTITAGRTMSPPLSCYPGCGAGIYAERSSLSIANLTFIGNLAYLGGGMTNITGTVIMQDTTFTNNKAAGAGGFFNVDSSPILTNIVFSNNYASALGGGMSTWGYHPDGSPSVPRLTSVRFEDNRSDYWAGGLEMEGSSPILSDVVFINNWAGGHGGGVAILYESNDLDVSEPTFINVLFQGNEALGDGGGIANLEFSNPLLINVIFSGNRAGQNGGAFSNRYFAAGTMVNVTVAGNRAGGAGGGIANVNDSLLTLTNVIVWGNADSSGTGTASATLSNQTGSQTTVAYSLLQGSGGSTVWNSAMGTDNGNNLDSDPLFVSALLPASAPTTGGNYALNFGSPAINSGNTFSNTTLLDVISNPRVIDSQIDLGAYEYQGVPTALGTEGMQLLATQDSVHIVVLWLMMGVALLSLTLRKRYTPTQARSGWLPADQTVDQME
ncbi:MAG: hypothetical protein KDE09_13330 [Anaerolineales bacterium]|nr:hypothetical protein [Anaerolineales bacterium]